MSGARGVFKRDDPPNVEQLQQSYRELLADLVRLHELHQVGVDELRKAIQAHHLREQWPLDHPLRSIASLRRFRNHIGPDPDAVLRLAGLVPS